jgi:hypothetical protein
MTVVDFFLKTNSGIRAIWIARMPCPFFQIGNPIQHMDFGTGVIERMVLKLSVDSFYSNNIGEYCPIGPVLIC